uniref:Uncharacterized protein n=1 Tax=Rangifer tarandus platyrhynchus TaxID=3082113 RepID=A0ACB0ELJ8_RANTA|nr:unnamed protein product [Rangifer tarandus platyrhynchus]
MAASSPTQVLDLYPAMLKKSKHFITYNYRTYTIRRIGVAFRENKNVEDPIKIQALMNKAKRDIRISLSTGHTGQLYSTDSLVTENQEKSRL